MTEYDVKLNKENLIDLLNKDEAIPELLTTLLNQILEQQMSAHLGAARSEQTGERQGYRNGHRARSLYTRVGHLNLRVPQTRDGSFSTEIFQKYQRSEKALVMSLMEMYLQGVSTRKVSKITEKLCGVSFSKSTVSKISGELDAQVQHFKNRSLKDKKYPFIIVDAIVIKVRRDDEVRATGFLIAYGINEDGEREVIGFCTENSETEMGWSTLFTDLLSRGLSGVDLIVSDAHIGLQNAIKKHFQGAQWQRCQTHFMRNILSRAGKHHRKIIAAQLKAILTAPDKKTARKLGADLLAEFEKKAPQSMQTFEEGFEEAITIMALPERYRQRLRTTNLAERNNEEIRRRERVIRIFPNIDAAERLIGALLAEKHEDWIDTPTYLNMTEYWEEKQEKLLKIMDENKEKSNIIPLK